MEDSNCNNLIDSCSEEDFDPIQQNKHYNGNLKVLYQSPSTLYNVFLKDIEKSQNKSHRPVFNDILNTHIKNRSSFRSRSISNKNESFPECYKPIASYNPALITEIKNAELKKSTVLHKIGLIMLTVTLILTGLAMVEEYYMMGSFI